MQNYPTMALLAHFPTGRTSPEPVYVDCCQCEWWTHRESEILSLWKLWQTSSPAKFALWRASCAESLPKEWDKAYAGTPGARLDCSLSLLALAAGSLGVSAREVDSQTSGRASFELGSLPAQDFSKDERLVRRFGGINEAEALPVPSDPTPWPLPHHPHSLTRRRWHGSIWPACTTNPKLTVCSIWRGSGIPSPFSWQLLYWLCWWWGIGSCLCCQAGTSLPLATHSPVDPRLPGPQTGERHWYTGENQPNQISKVSGCIN